MRLWARTTSDYSKAFTRIRDAVAALPVESAVLDGEAIVMRSADRCDFEALRSRQGQAEAILVAYDIMEVDGQDVRPEPLEERRKRLTRLLSRSNNKALRDGIQLSEATHPGYRRVAGTDHPDLCRVQSSRRPDFLSGRLVFRSMGAAQCSAHVVRDLFDRLRSTFC